jgi:hypothetical protein
MKQGSHAILRTQRADLDDFFLDQLRVLIARQQAAPTPRERVALSQATFAVFLDCQDLGLTMQAQALMGQALGERTPGFARRVVTRERRGRRKNWAAHRQATAKSALIVAQGSR